MATGKHIVSNDDSCDEHDIHDPLWTTVEANKDDENSEFDSYVPPTGQEKDKKQKYNEIITKEVRLVLVGRTGSGKSSTCNSILDCNVFQTSIFMQSATTKTKHGRRQWGNRDLIVIDTPGFFDTDQSDDQIESEVVKCVGMLSPGPHAFLYTIKIGCRHTKEEVASLQKLIELFGNKIIKFLIIIFTGKDILGDMELKTYLQNTTKDFNTKLEKVGKDKCFAISNDLPKKSSEDKVETVNAILSKINEMIHISPQDSVYTNEMLESAQSPIMMRAIELEDEVTPAFIRKELENEGSTYRYLMNSPLSTMVAKTYAEMHSRCIIL